MIDQIRNFLEQKVFGVCTYLGNKMGIASRYVRLFFIYSVFVANWSPIIIYMILACKNAPSYEVVYANFLSVHPVPRTLLVCFL